jgi:hypothetical protein
LIGCLLLSITLGCSNDDDAAGVAGSAAAALIRSMTFDNGTLQATLIPDTTAPEVSLLAFPETTVTPGADLLMPFDVNGVDAASAAAMLIQFDDTEQHFRVSLLDDGQPSSLSVHSTVAADVCAGLCDTTFPVEVAHAVELLDGRISARATATFTLDCRSGGNHSLCAASSASPAAQRITDAYSAYYKALCTCSSMYCGFEAIAPCMGAAFGDRAAEVGDERIQCEVTRVMQGTTCVGASDCSTAGLEACIEAGKTACAEAPASVALALGECVGIYACGGVPGGETYDRDSKCDGYEDCSDGSDEIGCGGTGGADAGGTVTTTCGDGLLETSAGEVCECAVGATAPCQETVKTCSDLVPGTVGTLLCDQVTCTYRTEMCMVPSGTAGAGGDAGGL